MPEGWLHEVVARFPVFIIGSSFFPLSGHIGLQRIAWSVIQSFSDPLPS
jgi:hypothetical protein